MALMTPEQYEKSIKRMKPRVFMNGKRVENILENKNTRTVVEANKASYAWALDPKYKDIMTVYSPLIGEVVNRYTYLSASIDDLVKKAQTGTFTSEMLGTCTYRCVGYDAFHSLASTTWEMDRDLGTEYHPRFLDFLKRVQKEDLSVSGALTEPHGSGLGFQRGPPSSTGAFTVVSATQHCFQRAVGREESTASIASSSLP